MSHSHRKVHSQGNIPFSWEDSPGVSKSMPQNDLLLDPTQRPLTSNFSNFDSLSGPIVREDIKIPPPPPPCQNLQPPRRSISGKGIGGWHEDPFLAAYKECTKGSCVGYNGKLDASENKKKSVKARKSYKFMFSCMNSSDVEDGSFMKLSNLPPIPRGRVKGL